MKMEIKKRVFIIIIIVLLAIFLVKILSNEDDWICVDGKWVKHGNPYAEIPDTPCLPKIGGERDEYGCLGAAGYTYDEEVEACIRTWELDEEQKQIAQLVVGFFGKEYGLTVSVTSMDCDDCLTVILNNPEDEIKRIDVIDNKIKEMTIQECEGIGGEPLNIVGGDYCDETTYNAGKAVGFISFNICCAPITDFIGCVKAGNAVMESYPRQCRTSDDKTFTEII